MVCSSSEPSLSVSPETERLPCETFEVYNKATFISDTATSGWGVGMSAILDELKVAAFIFAALV